MSVEEVDGESKESMQSYSNYSDVKGFLFPMNMSMNMGPMILSGNFSKVQINGKMNIKFFTKKED